MKSGAVSISAQDQEERRKLATVQLKEVFAEQFSEKYLLQDAQLKELREEFKRLQGQGMVGQADEVATKLQGVPDLEVKVLAEELQPVSKADRRGEPQISQDVPSSSPNDMSAEQLRSALE